MVRQQDRIQRSVCYWIREKEIKKPDAYGRRRRKKGLLDEEEEFLISSHAGGEPGEVEIHPMKKHTLIDTDDVVDHYGIPQSLFMKYLSYEVASADSCQSLPFTLLLVISFVLSTLNHDDAPQVNSVEDSIGFDILDNAEFAIGGDVATKGMHDVNSHADFWSWMTMGFVPLLWTQSFSFSENHGNESEPYGPQAAEMYARKNRGVLLNYNRIVLGVRLVQERDQSVRERTHKGDCKFKELQNMYGMDCVGGHGYELEPETWDARQTRNPTRKHWLYIHDDIEFVREQLVEMEIQGWLDPHTRKIEIAFPVYNAEFGLHTMFICCFFFSRGGHIWKDVIPLSAFAQNWNSLKSVFFDIAWVLCISWIFMVELLEIRDVLQDHGAMGFLEVYIGFWNGVDWLSVAGGVVIMLMFFINFNNTGAMNNALNMIGQTSEIWDRDEYRKLGKIYVDELQKAVQYSYNYRLVQAGYPAIIAMRLFKAFNSQPKLAVVTLTLQHALVDLIHFLLIFSSVFLSYMVAGVVLFGREVSSFTTVFRSLITCFRFLFGDFDWEEMREVGRVDAFFWFAPFVVIIFFILQNMLIAIVMDAYDTVCVELEGEDSVFEVMFNTIKKVRAVRKGEEMALYEVWRAMHIKIKEEKRARQEAQMQEDLGDEIDSDDSGGDDAAAKGRFLKKHKRVELKKDKFKEIVVTASSLRKVFVDKTAYDPDAENKMTTPQARRLVRNAILYYYQRNKHTGDDLEALKAISDTSWGMQLLKKDHITRHSYAARAIHFPKKVNRLSTTFYSEMAWARHELSNWLPDDHRDPTGIPGDVILPKHWFRARREPQDLSSIGGPGGKDTVRLLPDLDSVLEACHEAGIPPTFDHLREQALGQRVHVVTRDTDGTVLCHVPGVGEIWFAADAFATNVKKEKRKYDPGLVSMLDSKDGRWALRLRAQELEQDCADAKEVVKECLEALSTLHEDVTEMQAEKDKTFATFQEYRRYSVAIQRRNVDEIERMKYCQDRSEEVALERDNYYEEAQRLEEEVQWLKDCEAEYDQQSSATSGSVVWRWQE